VLRRLLNTNTTPENGSDSTCRQIRQRPSVPALEVDRLHARQNLHLPCQRYPAGSRGLHHARHVHRTCHLDTHVVPVPTRCLDHGPVHAAECTHRAPPCCAQPVSRAAPGPQAHSAPCLKLKPRRPRCRVRSVDPRDPHHGVPQLGRNRRSSLLLPPGVHSPVSPLRCLRLMSSPVAHELPALMRLAHAQSPGKTLPQHVAQVPRRESAQRRDRVDGEREGCISL